MITISGKSLNIKKPTVCRINLDNSEFGSTTSDFLLTSNLSHINENYSGYILNTKMPFRNNGTPIFICESDNFNLLEGDILLIYPDGNAIKLYDPSSKTNSIFLTERCNCNCLTCPQPPKKSDEKDWLEICLKTIELMNPKTECIGITGGEPTLVWESFIDILKKCKINIPDTAIQILTNARILKDYAKAKEIEKIDSNLFFGVPLYSDIDSIHDKMVGVKGAFWETIEGLYNIELIDKYIELRIVITKQNYERLPQFAEFVYKTMPFIGSVAFMGMEPIGTALQNLDLLWIDPVDYSDKLEKALRILWKRDISVMIFNHQLCTLPDRIWPLAKRSISEWKIRYSQECFNCMEKENCGGFFFSGIEYKSRGIKPIT